MSRTLLVIDVQADYFPGGTLPLWEVEETQARIVSAIARARGSGDRLVLVRHVSTQAAGLFASNGPGIAISPAILAAAGDAPIVTKHAADAFQDTDLADHLAGTEELLIAGMMTQNCVVFTALSRAADAFRVRVVGDLCTAPTETVHRIALAGLRSKLEVTTSEQVWG
ncbi:MAG: isochorismatase [Chelatococcus sp.]|nr:MAG: isochorismatase [Chelatococcus sp.]